MYVYTHAECQNVREKTKTEGVREREVEVINAKECYCGII